MESMRYSSHHEVNARKAKPSRAPWLVLAQATLCLPGTLTSLATLHRVPVEEPNNNPSSSLYSQSLSVMAHMESTNKTKLTKRRNKKMWRVLDCQQTEHTTNRERARPLQKNANGSALFVSENDTSGSTPTSSPYSDCSTRIDSHTSQLANRDFGSFRTYSARRRRLQLNKRESPSLPKDHVPASQPTRSGSPWIALGAKSRASRYLVSTTNHLTPQHQSKSTNNLSSEQNYKESAGWPKHAPLESTNGLDRLAALGPAPTNSAETWRVIQRPTGCSKTSQGLTDGSEPSASEQNPTNEQNTKGSESSILSYSSIRSHNPKWNKNSADSTPSYYGSKNFPLFSPKEYDDWLPFARRLAPKTQNETNRPSGATNPPFWCLSRLTANLQNQDSKKNKPKSSSVLGVSNTNESETPNQTDPSEEEALRMYREAIAAIFEPRT